MIKLSKYIPLNELGEATSRPFDYEPHFYKKYDEILLVFKDDKGDEVKVEFVTDGDGREAWEANISSNKILYVPAQSYSIGFAVNEIEANDIKDDNAKYKQTNIQYYTRLIATLKNICSDFIRQYNPNCIFAGKYDSGQHNRQKEIRFEVYSRLFQNHIPSGYEYINLENSTIVGIIKSKYKKYLRIE